MRRFVKLVCAAAILLPASATIGCGDSSSSAPVPHVNKPDPSSPDSGAGGKGRPRAGSKGAPPRLDD